MQIERIKRHTTINRVYLFLCAVATFFGLIKGQHYAKSRVKEKQIHIFKEKREISQPF
jgi:hypothetical protein